MIVSTPIKFPALVPDDWDKWWDIWNKHAKPLVKTGVSPNSESGLHFGFDVYKVEQFKAVYTAEFVDLKELYPSLFSQIMSLPVTIHNVRFVRSLGHFPAHVDEMAPTWALRNMFHCDDPKPQWYYTSLDGTYKKYLPLPENRNWWAYYDGYIKHGTIYREEYPKIIVQVFADSEDVKRLAENSFSKFPDHLIDI